MQRVIDLCELCVYSPSPCSQNNASKLLLAIMESRHDSENAERILFNMRPKELVSALARLSVRGSFSCCPSKPGRSTMASVGEGGEGPSDPDLWIH